MALPLAAASFRFKGGREHERFRRPAKVAREPLKALREPPVAEAGSRCGVSTRRTLARKCLGSVTGAGRGEGCGGSGGVREYVMYMRRKGGSLCR